MTLTQEQLEWIVSEVVRRLSASSPGNTVPLPAMDTNQLRLSEKLVTLETLSGRLSGVKQLQVALRAIVTPAVLDLLKDQNIELIRV